MIVIFFPLRINFEDPRQFKDLVGLGNVIDTQSTLKANKRRFMDNLTRSFA